MLQFDLQSSNRVEARGLNLGTTLGTNVQSTVVNTKGNYALLGAASFNYEMIEVALCGVPNANSTFYVDIAVGASTGAARMIAEGIALRCNTAANNESDPVILPIHVPAGTNIYARQSGATNFGLIQMSLIGHSQGLNGAPGYSRMVNLTNSGSGGGFSASFTSAGNGSKSRGVIVASSAFDVKALQLRLRVNTVPQRYLIDLEVGASGSEEVISPNNFLNASTIYLHQHLPIINRAFPAGSRFCLNAQANGASSGFNYVLYGFQ